jgi:hypothetical protein
MYNFRYMQKHISGTSVAEKQQLSKITAKALQYLR